MKIQTKDYTIVFGKSYYSKLSKWIHKKNYSKIVVLTDTNTTQYCLPTLLQNLAIEQEFECIEVQAGEESKSLQICEHIWQALLEYSIDRKALIINLGGGMITDLGGFVASVFKRGIDFVNIPTTLLSMVDASVGGKTGINLGFQKNMIGTFHNPQWVVIDVDYLSTLSGAQMRSGLAEMMKHGLIADNEHWNTLQNLAALDISQLEQLIFDSISIKNNIVRKDPHE